MPGPGQKTESEQEELEELLNNPNLPDWDRNFLEDIGHQTWWSEKQRDKFEKAREEYL